MAGGLNNGRQQPPPSFGVGNSAQIDEFFQLSRPEERELALWKFRLTVSDVVKLLHPSIKVLRLQDMGCTEDALHQITRELRNRMLVQKQTINNVQRVQKTPVFRILTMTYFTQTLKEPSVCISSTLMTQFGRNLVET